MKVHPTSNTGQGGSSSFTMTVPRAELATSSAHLQSSTSTSTPATLVSHAHQSDEDGGAVIEGDSSLAAHSVFATEFVQKVVSTESLQDSSLDLGETLEALSQIVHALKQPAAAVEMTYPHAKPVNRLRIQGLEMPPIEKAVGTIRVARGQRLSGMAWIYDFLPSRRFPDLCLDVYFSDNYSDYDFITVNGGLYSLFTDYAAQISGEDRKEYMEYAKICRVNLETFLLNLPLHLPASSDVIVALLFGAFHAVEISKPSLAWTLVSKASELCQTLGYHRVESLKVSKSDIKPTVHGMHWHQFLFWNVYYIDKSLSLRLGRASTIPDWHITMPLPSVKEQAASPILPYLVLWVKTAKCQGQIYEKLYSPDSITQPYHVRQMRIHELVSSLHDIEVRTQELIGSALTRGNDVAEENFSEFYVSSDSVLRLSLLTLVYRAAPRVEGSPTTFSPECVKAARAALEKHRECVAIMRKSHDVYFSSYMHWTVLFSPFIPFIVLFCQVIETQDRDDLARLHSFVVFLQETATMSDAAGKMSRLFQVLYSVALRFVEFRATTPHSRQTEASAEMDAYLAALGFPPKATVEERPHYHQPSTLNQNTGHSPELFSVSRMTGMSVDSMDEDMRPGNPMMWMTNAAQLEDFFYSNTAMMDLLQDPNFDLSQ
ncbi:fungal specific transcription factor domain-containing protein [Colletotrichum graminicola M1.001]|uniref:Fungal specific transcription factor domain-containing protein n=1 Tax=Colletotrichum graminicola (strain M1.001 / M2 / FGSC 10212) TaxID=645133 RepID=E3Q4J1_COLGM|nr:fungal specific transcription factor domain-containing protein [Colletotrichum graminicola M1.001]EFQ26006.1 fungal specific transcription factor domain-containing protein [Colletotrichum graminicola M1.001]